MVWGDFGVYIILCPDARLGEALANMDGGETEW